jgi:hypothetical protein
MTDGKSENYHYRNVLSDVEDEDDKSGVSDSEEEKEDCQHPEDCDKCSQSVTLVESLDTEDEKQEDQTKINRLKIANELNQINKMFLLSKLTEQEIKDYIATNLTEDADKIREDYFRLFYNVKFTDPIKIETYGLLVKLGILEQVKATHDDLYEPSKIKL